MTKFNTEDYKDIYWHNFFSIELYNVGIHVNIPIQSNAYPS